jgi:hypothetical protein
VYDPCGNYGVVPRIDRYFAIDCSGDAFAVDDSMGHHRRLHGDRVLDRCSGDDHSPGVDIRVVGYVVGGRENRLVDHDSLSEISLRFDVDRRFVAVRFGEDRFDEDLLPVGGCHFVNDSHFDEDLVVVRVDPLLVNDSHFDEDLVVVRVDLLLVNDSHFDEDLVVVRVDLLLVNDSHFDEDLVVVRVDLLFVDDRRFDRFERCLDRSSGALSLTCRVRFDVVMGVTVSWQAQPFVQLVRRRASRRGSCYPVVRSFVPMEGVPGC